MSVTLGLPPQEMVLANYLSPVFQYGQWTSFTNVCLLAVEKKAAARQKRDDLIRRNPGEMQTGAKREMRTDLHTGQLTRQPWYTGSHVSSSGVRCLQSQIWPVGGTVETQTPRPSLMERTERRSLWHLWPAPVKTSAAI